MNFYGFFTKDHISNKNEKRDWKEKNKRYLNQLQRFLDATDRIQEEELRNHIIAQMLKCDLILTELAENEMAKIRQKNTNPK